MPHHKTFALIGCGNMGAAVVQAARSRFDHLLAFDPNADKCLALDGVTIVDEPAQAVEQAQVVLLAIKPQVMADAIRPIAPVAANRLFVSVAAGITTRWLEERLPGGRVVRTMPNTPLLVNAGAVGLCGGATATTDDLAIARLLFGDAVMVEVDESRMDAVTAISGSGPAYFFAFVEALASAGVAAGLSVEDAGALARQTFIGAARLLAESDESPVELRRRVTSPNGTTAAALASFEKSKLERIVENAVLAARDRGRELAS